MESPPVDIAAQVGDLYVYTARCNNMFYTWLYGEKGWYRVSEGVAHPLIPGRQLAWRTIDEPSWVTAHTYLTYQGKARRIGLGRKVYDFSSRLRIY